jgi:hypothetical protein
MRIPVVDVIAGTTLRTTWVSSGMVPTSILSSLRSGSETLVHSISAVSSGNGFFFALHPVPISGGWYINEWVAQVGVNTYVNRQLVRAVRLEAE